MGLFDFFKKPKWKHSNSRVRLEAVEEMGRGDLDTLREIIRRDSDSQVRQAALEKIGEPEILESMLTDSAFTRMEQSLRERLQTVCVELILAGDRDEDAGSLLARITDEQLLARLAVEAEAVELRCLAVEAIEDPRVLGTILREHCGKKPALAAIEKIDDTEILEELATRAVNKAARKRAAQKLKKPDRDSRPREEGQDVAPEPGEPLRESDAPDEAAAEARRIAEKIRLRQSLCVQIEELRQNPGEKSEARLAELQQSWPADEPTDSAELEELALSFKSESDRLVRVLEERRAEIDAVADLEKSCGRIEKLLRKKKFSEAETLLAETGSRLEKTRWQWADASALKDRYAVCMGTLEKKRQQEEEQRRQKERQVHACTEICARLEELLTVPDRYEAEKEARELQKRWKEIDGNSAEPALRERYRDGVDIFWERQKQFYKEKEWERWTNKTKKEELCLQVESFRDEEDMRLVSRGLKECQAAWKEIGPVPREESDALWERFRTVCDEQFERCRVFFAELDRKRQESTAIKEKLCEQAEEHVESTEWKESADFLKGLQKKWKEAGPGEREKDDELYARFRAACDRFFERRNAWFAEMDALRKENLAAKEQLCEEVEALVREPRLEYGKLIPELQKKWKEIGPVPRKNDQEIWQRFRGACDGYYEWLDSCRQENLARKVALCEQVEALLPENEDEERRQEAMEKVKQLQQEWKTIGPVPRAEADGVWERFRGTCDLFFVDQKKRIEEENRKREENQLAKEALLQKAGEVIGLDDERQITEGLKELQKQWKEIGPAPRDREQLLWDEFHGLCNAFFKQKQERYQERKAALDEILTRKEELCFQLERLAGKEEELAGADADEPLDLVERFRIAREANFLLAGKTDNLQKKKEEVRRIQQEWKNLGSTYREQEQRLWKRYRTAIDQIFEQKPMQKKLKPERGRETAQDEGENEG